MFLNGTEGLAWESYASVVLTIAAIAIQVGGGAALRGSYQQRQCASSGLVLGILTPVWVASGMALRDGGLGDGMLSSALNSTLMFGALSLLFIALRAGVFGSQNLNIVLWALASFVGMFGAKLMHNFDHPMNQGMSSELAISACMCAGFHFLMLKIPGSLTIGEALLFVQGIRFACRPAAIALLRDGWSLLSDHDQNDAPTVAVMTSMFGLISLLGVATYALLMSHSPAASAKPRQLKGKSNCGGGSLGKAVAFSIFILTLASLAAAPTKWVLIYVFTSTERLKLIMFWAASLMLALPAMKMLSTSGKMRKIIVRKGYHALAVILFLPALLTQPSLLSVALAVAFAVLAAVEVVRLANVSGISAQVHHFMSSFVDARDAGAFYVTHFTLLLGLAIPIWLTCAYPKTSDSGTTLPSLAGILSTGIGDAAASIIGSSFGKIRIARDSRKTVEGTLAGMTAMLTSIFVFYLYEGHWTMKTLHGYNNLVVCTLLSALLEASTDQFDNVFVALHFFSLLCALD